MDNSDRGLYISGLVRLPFLLFVLLVAGCGDPPVESEDPSLNTSQNRTAILLELMTGSFSSEAQAATDERYFDIRLEMMPIWKGRPDGPWLYVEQAAASRLDQPYRQRVYRLWQNDAGEYVSTVYELPDPLSHAGAWQDDAPLSDLSPDELMLREGCDVLLHETGERRLSGSTVASNCASSFGGASYATSEVEVTGEGIRSWDRGFDASGNQVWGAEDGPYIFLRQRD